MRSLFFADDALVYYYDKLDIPLCGGVVDGKEICECCLISKIKNLIDYENGYEYGNES